MEATAVLVTLHKVPGVQAPFHSSWRLLPEHALLAAGRPSQLMCTCEQLVLSHFPFSHSLLTASYLDSSCVLLPEQVQGLMPVLAAGKAIVLFTVFFQAHCSQQRVLARNHSGWRYLLVNALEAAGWPSRLLPSSDHLLSSSHTPHSHTPFEPQPTLTAAASSSLNRSRASCQSCTKPDSWRVTLMPRGW